MTFKYRCWFTTPS